MAPRTTDTLFNPRSVAIVGASDVLGKWGYAVSKNALRGQHRRRVFLVNRNGGTVLGQKTYTSLVDLPECPELVVIAVPAGAAEPIIDQALAQGTKAFVMVTGGFSESGGDGKRREEALVARIRTAGAILVGPNCPGLHDTESELYVCYTEYPKGSVGIVSQSGMITHDLGRYCSSVGMGFSRAIPLGNQADFNLCDAIESFAKHDATQALVIYCEDLLDGRAFMRAASKVSEAGKAVILITIGTSSAAAKSAMSHTGALVTDAAIVNAACRMSGVYRASSTREAIDLAQAFSVTEHRPHGLRVGIVTDGGGHGTLSSDLLSGAGLEIPTLSPALQTRLRHEIGPRASTANPIDMAGDADQDLSRYHNAVKALLDSGEVDTVLMTGFFGGYSRVEDTFGLKEPAVAMDIVESTRVAKRPTFVHTLYPEFATGLVFRSNGVPVYRDIDGAARALGALAASAGRSSTRRQVPKLPAAEVSLIVPTDYWEARQFLQRHAIAFPVAELVHSKGDLQPAADRLGFPLALKAVGILHKSEHGGVALGIKDMAELTTAFLKMHQRLRANSYSLERLAPLQQGVELLVGAKQDPRFGPVITVGFGGIFAEIFDQVALSLTPIDKSSAKALLLSLRGAPLLTGARGRPPLDIHAAASVISALGDVAARHRDQIQEIEINPVLILEHGAIALDARIIRPEGVREHGAAHEL